MADAPFVFANRIGVTAALSRMELFKKVAEIPGAIIECGVYKGNSLMLYMHLSMIQDMIDANDLLRPVNRIPRCELVKGDIVKTVPEWVQTRPDLVVAMLILDTDLYESTKVALETFLPYMPKGAIVVLDEVAYRNLPGETKALREVLDLNKIELKRLPFDSCVGYFHV